MLWTRRSLLLASRRSCKRQHRCKTGVASEIPSHHQADSLDVPQVQRLSIFLLPASICGLEVIPVHENFSAVIVSFEIVLPADSALLSTIGTLWQEFVFQYQCVLLPI